MWMERADIRAFPRLAHWVRVHLPTSIDNGPIRTALARRLQERGAGAPGRAAGASADGDPPTRAFRRGLRWGSGPRIRVVALDETGSMQIGESSADIFLSRRLVDELESGRQEGPSIASTDRSEKGPVTRLSVALLRGLAAWVEKDVDEGSEPPRDAYDFDRMVYGGVIV